MVHIAIVEDEISQVALFVTYLERYRKERSLDMAWHTYPDGDLFIEAFSPGKYDIVLLDIQMKRMDGLKTAREIRARDDAVAIIFITNLVQCAIQGYAVRALDFIVKPVEYGLFAQKLQNAIGRLQRIMQGTVSFRVADGIANLNPASILYFEIVSRKVYIHTETQTYRCNDTLQNIEQRLGDRRFFRCHAGYLVNVARVSSIKKDHALIGDVKVPISRHRRKDFLDAVGNYFGSEI